MQARPYCTVASRHQRMSTWVDILSVDIDCTLLRAHLIPAPAHTRTQQLHKRRHHSLCVHTSLHIVIYRYISLSIVICIYTATAQTAPPQTVFCMYTSLYIDSIHTTTAQAAPRQQHTLVTYPAISTSVQYISTSVHQQHTKSAHRYISTSAHR
jgi:hypothetical protein